jgi:hypothetical protein
VSSTIATPPQPRRGWRVNHSGGAGAGLWQGAEKGTKWRNSWNLVFSTLKIGGCLPLALSLRGEITVRVAGRWKTFFCSLLVDQPNRIILQPNVRSGVDSARFEVKHINPGGMRVVVLHGAQSGLLHQAASVIFPDDRRTLLVDGS